ncbi:LytR/AlgR family response regulator transcription factor [Aestuariivivens marinum]|uniref:LytR/AlgR family response regulator transcription factor n=1 Tax=Aestuariivivens marinum TaxID=2913555 RepID=UPI001F5A36F6|nr:response regulator transcription factor [Aestuariivivens marinum]
MTTMITAIAIDDEPKAIKVIEHHASKIEHLQLVAHFYNADDALQFLRQNPIDFIFLDINMPNVSGMEMLNKLQHQPLIVFTTAYSEYALESYNFNAVDYLLKPFELDRFQLAIKKVEERLESTKYNSSYFFIKDGFKTIKIAFEDILHIKGSGNYLDVVSKEKTFSPRMTFTEIVEKLPASQFVRVHQSYVINISKIDKIENNHVSIGEHKIPIGNRYKTPFLKRLDLG